jgi:hypothetical protein
MSLWVPEKGKDGKRSLSGRRDGTGRRAIRAGGVARGPGRYGSNEAALRLRSWQAPPSNSTAEADPVVGGCDR